MGLLHDRIERESRTARRFGAMVDRLDVDTGGLGGDELGHSLRKAIERCRGCRATTACESWLAAGSTSEPGFCPNLQLFEGFARRRA